MIRNHLLMASILFLATGHLPANRCNAQNEPAETGNAAGAPETPTGSSPRKPSRERTPDYWTQQLASPRFLRRESAERHLYEAGPDVIPLLVETLRRSDFETTKRIISVMSKIANTEGPAVTEGAYEALQKIAKRGIGSKAAIAATTLEHSKDARKKEAISRLTQSGIFVGDDEKVALGSQTSSPMHARVDDGWDKSRESLPWFRWLTDIDFAVIRGTAASAAVFEAVARMPDLRILVIADCELDTVSIESLQSVERIDVMDIRYVKLSEAGLQALSRLSIRNKLHLMGVDISDARIAKMEVDMPGVEINFRKGGFLGVMCSNPRGDVCMVSDVLPDSAAKLAGLAPGDIIVKIDDAVITRFEDLQAQVNRHTQGETIQIQFRRENELAETQATLGKLAE